jgi:hypothetical protein
MKKIAPYIVLFVIAMVFWEYLTDSAGMHVEFDGEEFDGPFGALIGLLAASGGILIGLVVTAIVGVILALVFAGVGVLLVCALVLAAVLVAAAVSPLLLPLLIPVAIIWYLGKRNRKNRLKEQAA